MTPEQEILIWIFALTVIAIAMFFVVALSLYRKARRRPRPPRPCPHDQTREAVQGYARQCRDCGAVFWTPDKEIPDGMRQYFDTFSRSNSNTDLGPEWRNIPPEWLERSKTKPS